MIALTSQALVLAELLLPFSDFNVQLQSADSSELQYYELLSNRGCAPEPATEPDSVDPLPVDPSTVVLLTRWPA